ncbi:MAG: GreA/GreB family elongation factor [Kiritimatiellae bacterium]|nr:GreA/GreB family elongation factor [Kiritimatiellia bacterium]
MDTNVAHNEDWFLAQLDAEHIELAPLTAWLSSVWADGRAEVAVSSSELLMDALCERGAVEGVLAVARLRAGWNSDDAATRARCRDDIQAALGATRDTGVLIEQSGFDAGLSLSECFRRLDLLLALKPETLCYEKTWGFGVVRKVDLFYANTVIDFEKKQDHTMSLAYAAEALQVLGDEHLLARRHRDPQAVEALVKNDPAELVRLTLRSYGPLNAVQLQDVLVPRILPEADWKRFWEVARRGLKKDPLVEVPARRTDPIRLLKQEKSYDAEWFAGLRSERRIEQVLEMIEEFKAQGDAAGADEGMREALADRLSFVFKGAGAKTPEYAAAALMLARELAVPLAQGESGVLIERYLEPNAFLAAVRGLPARDVGRFLGHLREHDADRLMTMLVGLVPRLELTVLNEALDLLIAGGREEDCARAVRELTEGQVADVEVLYWLFRHPDRMQAWSLGTVQDLARWMLRAIEYDHSGEKLKTQNQLRSRFSEEGWIEAALGGMSDGERRDFLLRLKDHPGFPALDRRSLLGRIVKTYPDLQELLVAKAEPPPERTARGTLTSWCSYAERQAQLEKIVNVEIPRVAREIAKARSYGDLSENHEYKAAKEMQAFLMRRRGELEQMLQQVRPTDFAGLPADAVGQGTGVTIEFGDGRREQYCILGAWDRDEKLGIISSDSRLAQVLDGHRAGEDVTVPTENGEAVCRIVEVTGLSEEVRAWVRGTVKPIEA